MPTYAYRCPTCDVTFDKRRPMSESSDPAQCPDGHEARRLLSVFATSGYSTPSSASSGEQPAWTGRDSACGGGCACH